MRANLTSIVRLATFTVAVLLSPAVLAQSAVGGKGDTFKDTSILKLPAGQRAAILEFEDLECPACAHAAPIVKQAIDKYKIPLLRHDFPLSQHIWSRDAAVLARYLQDKVNPELAEQYRLDVFANQTSISSKEDMQNFSRSWFQKHGQVMPFSLNPVFAAEVQSDATLGERLGVQHTPTIMVLGPRGWVQIVDIAQLYSVIDTTLAETPAAVVKPTSSGAAKGGPKKPIVTPKH
jgi:protein-disulfide isomerase